MMVDQSYHCMALEAVNTEKKKQSQKLSNHSKIPGVLLERCQTSLMKLFGENS